MGVALPPAEAQCTYWCMNPVAREYECCDEGNPWYTGVEEPVDAEVETVDAGVEVIDTKTPVEGVDGSVSSGCVYYCYYNGLHYCCDNGENPIPDDHKDHAGKCPTEKEQSCKLSAADKKPVTKISSVFVDKHDKMCASDGYCGEEEKCCPNKCHKKHTCMPSF